MTCNLAVFRITDGEFTVNLLDPAGFSVVEWEPAAPDFKGGGVWGDSPMVDGSYPVFGVYENAQERVVLTVNGSSIDTVANKMQTLRRLLRQASVFWFGRLGPVWIEARTHGETNTRYAVLASGSIPNDGVVYGQPAVQQDGSAVMDRITMTFSRLHWTENLPGVGTAVDMSQVSAYNGSLFGTVDVALGAADTSTEVYVSNKQNIANITNIHNSTGGANLLDSLPMTLFDGSTTLLFGISAAVADSGPFNSLVFNLTETNNIRDVVVTWEYLSAAGPTWTALSHVIDNTTNFSILGINSVHWTQPNYNIVTSPGGGLPAGFWVRARISAGTLATDPVQDSFNPYTVIKPYADIAIDEIDGDIPALMQLTIENPSGFLSETFGRFVSGVVGGIKTIGEDSSFTPIINLSDEQNPTGITVTSAFFATLAGTPTGRIIRRTGGGAFGTVTIDSAILNDFIGSYRLFLRCNASSGPIVGATASATIAEYDAGTGFGFASMTTRTEPVKPVSNGLVAVDLGIIELPLNSGYRGYVPRKTGNIQIGITINTDVSTVMDAYDICLIPIDEWAFEVSRPIASSIFSWFDSTRYLKVDGIESIVPRAAIWSFDNEREIGDWTLITNGRPRLNAGRIQRLCLLSIGDATIPETFIETVFKVSLLKNQQYLSLRGEY